MKTGNDLYDQDFHAWAEQQVRLLRCGQLADADLEHLAEEIETLGASERRELESRLKVLLLHLLKWQYQPENRSSGWIGSIDEQRDQIDTLLRQSPSMKGLVAEYIGYAYPKARRSAARETGLANALFPPQCTYSEQEILNPDFWPDGLDDRSGHPR
ncbi:MAG: DUF29 domain-containing protein [Thiohalocapsa sp.]